VKYIQCPHCDKKYAASDKLCAAAGKKIRCKHCRQIFKILIYGDDVSAEQKDIPPPADNADLPNESPDQEKLPDRNNEPEKKTEPVKKKFNIQLLISIVLAFLLLTTATAAYLFFYQHELFEPSKKQDAKHMIPGKLINPVNITFPQQKPAMDSGKSEQSEQNPDQTAAHAQKPKSWLEGPDNPSQVCKDSSADYWFRTRLLVTSPLDTATYMDLLNQNMDQADEIRRVCKGKLLIARITESAKTGQIPAWIKTEIQSRNKAMQIQAGPPQAPP